MEIFIAVLAYFFYVYSFEILEVLHESRIVCSLDIKSINLCILTHIMHVYIFSRCQFSIKNPKNVILVCFFQILLIAVYLYSGSRNLKDSHTIKFTMILVFKNIKICYHDY
ncbi:hypothetical protein EDEG_03168 [Edhazardia aedis USNM 41457]|uniref:Uncharacterized protein n=1 Tax=Edhazardia aedis (strain USNM 41457) TaxID=1003232 RepID=J9D4C9_EDHAE|nr:hypothetical protein EDEG_03168 [Edhazardia aedis USNM 41457]|eukprot:EJW02409.1 hypothetical protein EDEG_03168 [Edhazardia aedis USNM 41457]